MRFLAIGEAMVELAPSSVEGDLHLGYAGDTFNTAWYLSQLMPDAQVGYYTAVGTDALSDKMLETMTSAGISTSHVQRDAARTVGLYMITLNNGERSFSYWRGQSAARRLAHYESALQAAMSDANVIFFSGITLAVLEDGGREKFITALKAARESGKTITFDPNLRPKLWRNTEEMTQSIMDGAAVSDIVLPSYEDEAEFFNDTDQEATLKRYLDAGATTVIVKDGPDPILYQGPAESGLHRVTPVAKVVDTTAAGDSFNAGFFTGMMKGKTLDESLGMGAALSGQVIQHKGALVEGLGESLAG